ncbi:MAG: T9SS type A sorting domain-containing protein [Saprospiraceae bacterium]
MNSYSLRLSLPILLLFLATPFLSGQKVLEFSRLCQPAKKLYVTSGDTLTKEIKTDRCDMVVGNVGNLQKGFYHCLSITKVYPQNADMMVELVPTTNFVIGYPNDKFIEARMLVFSGDVDESVFTNSYCVTNNPTQPTAKLDTLFDSKSNGTSFAKLHGYERIMSKASNGSVTVVIYLLSLDLGNFELRANLVSRGPSAECILACHDDVTISLNSTCSRIVAPGDVLAGFDPVSCQDLILMLEYPYPYYNQLYPDRNIVDASLVGQKLVYKVIDPYTNNYCWGNIKVEDKYPPQVLCQNDTVSCLNLDEAVHLVSSSDNCRLYGDPKIDILAMKWVGYDCNTDTTFLGYVARQTRVSDVWGNYRQCSDTIFVWRESLDSLVCPPDTAIDCTTEVVRNGKLVELLWNSGKDGDTYLDAQGYAHPWPTKGDGYFPAPSLASMDTTQPDAYFLPERSDDGPVFNQKSKCQFVAEYEDFVIPTCGKSYKIRRVWSIYDWCSLTDTQCVQWFKIMDTMGPQLDLDYISNLDGGNCTELDVMRYPTLVNKAVSSSAYLLCEVIEAGSDAHDCKSAVTLPDPRKYVAKDCDDVLEVYYEVEYADPAHPGKSILQQGKITQGGTAHLYLPDGWHCVTYTIRDRCWNETQLLQGVSVFDNTPPTPVCDEITQVTLDPKECWARIYAKDLDDGSHDNCCEQLHFAVASMDSINYWQNYWHDYIVNCVGHYAYLDDQEYYDHLIEEWINVFIFDDYIDVSECGNEMLVMRVYEACGLPVYDEHLFHGGEHEWYWWNLSADFASYYLWRLDDYIHYGDPRPDLVCDASYEGGIAWDVPLYSLGCPIQPDEHAPYLDGLCAIAFNPSSAQSEWTNRVLNVYPSETQITRVLMTEKRYRFPHLYNDCMVEVLKDDKQPPEVVAPDDLTVYCDGVPFGWSVVKPYDYGTKTATVTGTYAQYTHDVCDAEDILTTHCTSPYLSLDRSTGMNQLVMGESACCVEYPWSSEYGYYGGSICSEDNHYSGTPGCDDFSEWYDQNDWGPIYCRIWLLLDKYDVDGVKPDPQHYFEETEDDWVIEDNCWYPDVEVAYDGALNECGVGTLHKTVTATDKCGNSSHDTQTLYVKPRSDFEVVFPADVHAYCDADGLDLSATPAGAGYPEISDDDCELIGITYSDEKFDIVDGACYKILRTWKVVDWCVYSPDIHHHYPDVIVDDRLVASDDRCCVHRNLKDDGDGYVTYLQVIKVLDHNAPVVTCNELPEACIFDNDCEGTNVNFELGTATDVCTPASDIRYRYFVKPFGQNVPAAYIYGNGNILSGNYPVGTHTVCLIAADLCGNEDTCSTTFTVRDCKKPTPYCFNGIATVIMPSSGSVDIWAIDLDAGSYDNCTPKEKLRFTFGPDHPDDDPLYDADMRSSYQTLTCDQLGQLSVTIYVWDEEGNYDACETYILVQPGSDACPDISLTTIEGQITTSQSISVEYVSVGLANATNEYPEFETKADGMFAFSGLPMQKTYHIAPERNNDYTNGVSTLDILEIQKHLLGAKTLTGPYNLIAADVNGDRKLSAVDLVELRKLVLGVVEALPGEKSWRFIPADQSFNNPDAPWDYQEEVTLSAGDEPVIHADFIGIKVGDVNHSNKANSQQFQAVEIRDRQPLVFQMEDRRVAAGNEVRLAVRAEGFDAIDGFQFTLVAPDLEILNVEPGALDCTPENFGLHLGVDGFLTASWNGTNPVTIPESEVLFTIVVRPNQSVQLSQTLSMTSGITKSEGYRHEEIIPVNLITTEPGYPYNGKDFTLFQNTPNPFADVTTIGFILPSAGPATLRIVDVSGREVFRYTGQFEQGYQQIRVDRNRLPGSGVLYYQLESGPFHATKKLVVID